MSDLEDGHGESNKETPQEAENDFDDVDFDINVSVDDDIQEIINSQRIIQHRWGTNRGKNVW